MKAILFALLLGARAEDDAQWHQQRDAEADNNFDTIMLQNAAAPARAPVALPSGEVALSGSIAPGTPSTLGEVTLPLERWDAARLELDRLRRDSSRTPPPLVVLGATEYRGRALPAEGSGGVLSLTLDMQVTLNGAGLWKTVPLIGEEVVITGARAGGRKLPLSSQNGYHVWVTRETGEVPLTLDILVPSRGRRGSLEFDFLAARTPVTRFSCEFPMAGLEPRLRGAVQAVVASTGATTRLDALLSPSSRVHLVGFKDMGDQEGREARVYAESLNLLSLDESTVEMFTVVRYNILYAGERQFDILVPAGMTVVSAEGEGAWRYTLEDKGEQGTLVHGETAFPIRNAYEVSLRLRREATPSGEPFTVALPRSLEVEREYGWLGVEVTGNIALDEVSREGAQAVDVRQLPWEMVQSAVSPVLRAWRTHSADSTVTLRGTRLPDVEPASASVDRVRADTVISAEGRVLTDVRITLRNRLRHSLALRLPEGMEVRSSLIDGEPVKPSRAADGALLFPLERSAQTAAGLVPFTLQVVMEGEGHRFWLFGRQALALPAVELPVSSVTWTVWMPAANRYAALSGDVAPQTYAGSGEWFEAPVRGGEGETTAGPGGESGAMPVRIELPRAGRSMATERFWIDGGVAVRVTTWYWRGWLQGPAVLGIFTLVAAGVVGAAERRARAIAAGVLVGAGLLVAASGVFTAGLALAAGAALLGVRRGVHRGMGARLREWWGRRPEASAWATRGPLTRLLLVFAGMGTGFLMLVAVLRWLALVGDPLGG